MMSPVAEYAPPELDFQIRRIPESPTLVIDLDRINTPGVRIDSEPKRRRRIRRKSVSFADEALVYSSDWQEEEVQQAWYTKEDLNIFKKERKEIVRLLKRLNFNLDAIDHEQFCLRGFEAYFSVEINRATKYARELIATTVFAEQNRQRAAGISDIGAIRRESMRASRWTLRNALELGSRDAAEVRMMKLQDRQRAHMMMQSWNDGRFTAAVDATAHNFCRDLLQTSLASPSPVTHAPTMYHRESEDAFVRA